MRLPFVKMHGLGNDFVVIDERDTEYHLPREVLARLGDRRLGVGCDQILFVERATSPDAAARYRVCNGDGSPAEHCGNGIRCVARYLTHWEGPADPVRVEIGDADYALQPGDGTDVRVEMGVPRFDPAVIPLKVDAQAPTYQAQINDVAIEFGAVSVGNPHAVVAVEDTVAADVGALGPALQSSDLFPQSVNVGFAQFIDSGHLALRVYERGAGETRACGTGACAAVAIGRRWDRLDARVEVALTGGVLDIEWSGRDDEVMWMSGPATYVFSGEIEL